jgi:predicted glycosyltransferase
VKIWIDIENPPQVQYLAPFEEAFQRRGVRITLTVRDYGNAPELLTQRGASFDLVGRESGRPKVAKVSGLLKRAHALASLMRRQPAPDVLLCSSRSAVLAARWMGLPSFIISDYEYANTSIFRLANSTILYPDVIEAKAFLVKGLRQDRLMPFRGLKEDISFSGVDATNVTAYRFPETRDESLVRVLFRPPAENSHYFESESREFALSTLKHLASHSEALVVFVPRHPWQRADLTRFEWRNDPIVLERALPFLSLLKAVDLVVCSGGTMLREAAYFGVPAYSILRSPIGGVDRYLESIGRVRVIKNSEELSAIDLSRPSRLPLLESNPHLLDEIAETVLDHAPGERL